MKSIEHIQKIKNNSIRRRAIHNMIIQNKNYIEALNCHTLYEALDEFLWIETKEGHEYWLNIQGKHRSL
jgi:hypothetical protein